MANQDTLDRTIYVGNLDENFDEEALRALFMPFGDIKNIEIPIDLATRKTRGFAFVEFEDGEDAEQAIDNMDDAEVFGKIIRVSQAKQSKNRMYSRAVWSDENYQKGEKALDAGIYEQ